MADEPSRRLALTGAGFAFAVTAAVAVTAGRVLAVDELSMAGLVLFALVGTSFAFVAAAGIDLHVQRVVRPHRVEAGDHFSVSLRVHNGRSFLRPPLVVEDSLGGRRVARVVLPQRRTDPAAEADYTVTAVRRGVTSFGDVTLVVGDPFGLVTSTVVASDPVDVIVLPRRHPLRLDPSIGADDPSGGVRHRRILAAVSEEFDSLRDYVPGDDVRRVHWASTARLGRPVVRTHQQAAQRRTTVVLDDRAAGWDTLDPDAFERAVSAAASLITAAHDAGDVIRLIRTSGADTGPVDDAQRLDLALDALAAVDPTPGGSLHGALAAADGERVVVCTARADGAAMAEVLAAASHGTDHVVIATSPGSTAPGSTAPAGTAGAAGGVRVVEFGPNADLAGAWRDVVTTRDRMAAR